MVAGNGPWWAVASLSAWAQATSAARALYVNVDGYPLLRCLSEVIREVERLGGLSLGLETQLDGFCQILPFQFQGDEWVVALDVFQWSTSAVLFDDLSALLDQLVVIQLK